MPTPPVLLTSSYQHELGSQEEWDPYTIVYQPYEVEQLLLPDSAHCLAVQGFLKMLQLPFSVQYRMNAEYMSPSGKVPFIRSGQFVLSELEPIVDFAYSKGFSLSRNLEQADKCDMRAYMSLVNNVLGNAETYIVWCDPETAPLTKQRCGSMYPYPLNYWIIYMKNKEAKSKLNAVGWLHKTLKEVVFAWNMMKPTELDALVFGHIFAILTTALPTNQFAATVRGYANLIDHCTRIEKQYFDFRKGDPTIKKFGTSNSSWIQELETALKEEYDQESFQPTDEDVDNITEIARPNVWQSCLDVDNMESKMDSFDDIFDLPEQKILREDCLRFVSKLGNNEEDKIVVLSDLESILTCHCKASSRRRKYESNNGWIDLLLPLITLKLPRSCMYNLFEAIYDKFIPRHVDSFHLLRLLLLYHDPQLCNFLDSKKVTADLFAKSWFQSLFASSCNLTVILSIWDLYFQKEDPFFVFFLALVIIVNDRDLILNLKDEEKSKIVEVISLLPSNLTGEDVTDFCALAQYYDSKSPSSFKDELRSIIFEESAVDNKESKLSQALCLPVLAKELISNSENTNDSSDSGEENVRFFLIDCRPAEQYNAGHPPTAFHLDCNLMLQEPNSFSTAVQGLLSCQRQALAANSKAGGEHLCFLGCGELLADQFTHMAVASFLQKHTHYVSLLTGGYEAFHKCLGEKASVYLRDHNAALCPVCQKEQSKSPKTKNKTGTDINGHAEGPEKSDIFGKIGAVMKLKSAEMKGKIAEYITNPTNSSNSAADRHVSSSDKIGKPYRNLVPIFSIDEEHQPDDSRTEEESSSSHELVKISKFLENPTIITRVKCQEVTYAGYFHECYLVCTLTHLMALRLTDKNDYAHITVNRPLAAIAKITCKKKHPEFVTFQYGSVTNITDMDRFLIPNSSETTKIISQQIMRIVEDEKKALSTPVK
ncbi:hypothetical protein V9T40_002657 [Parthenolecanium corni]|uniref:TBC1 domain family member 23 n=1 Tax=Parthenolecanium corni TaxID=536013 RepID=A0AAN9TKU3_9HEMI